jgi:lipopolysaccharide transport system permease protein
MTMVEGERIRRPIPLFHYLAETWRYRFLIGHLVGADMRSRFRRSHLGILWALLQPLLLSLMFAFVLANIFQQEFKTFALFVFAGVVLWEFLTGGISVGMHSLLQAEGHLRQARIPALVFHIRSTMHCLVLFFFGMLSFFLFALVINPAVVTVYWAIYVPAFTGITLLMVLPLTMITSVINMKFRDFQQGIGLALQFLWYLSPVFIAREVFKRPELAWWDRINPVAALCDLFRDPMLYQRQWDPMDVYVFLAWTAAAWVFAIITVWRNEKRIVFYY